MEGNGITPVMPVGNNYGEGFGGGCGAWLMWVLVIFALMGGNGFGLGGNGRLGNALTQAEMQEGFNHQDTASQIRGITSGLSDGFYATNTGILQNRAEIGKTVMEGFNGLEKTVMQTGYGIGTQLSDNRFGQQQCCCETNRNIDSVRTEGYRNSCEIKNAIHEEGEKTRAMMMDNQIQQLRDRLADNDRKLQSAAFQLSQVDQTSKLVNQLRPFPTPAYLTASPYQAMNGYYGTCGGVMV